MTTPLHYSLLLALCLLLAGCDQLDLTPKPTTPTNAASNDLIELDAHNINAFTAEFAQTYLNTLDDLLTAFNKYNHPDSSYEFVQFRNNQWTPRYIERKDHYQAMLQKNKDFLAQSSHRPLFDYFEKLIYIGIDLKKGLMDKRPALIKKALRAAKQDRSRVETILKTVKSSS